MPAAVHLAPRLLAGSTTEGISATAIGLIVGIGIIPVFILIWVVSWLFWCYPNNRTCCCTRRKRKSLDEMVEKGEISQETLHQQAVHDIPERPTATYRTESGSSGGTGRLIKTNPRISLQTVGSGNSVQVVQEPKHLV